MAESSTDQGNIETAEPNYLGFTNVAYVDPEDPTRPVGGRAEPRGTRRKSHPRDTTYHVEEDGKNHVPTDRPLNQKKQWRLTEI